MRNMFLVLLAGVLVLSAVQWDTEQITNVTESNCWEPILTLDADGTVRVLYGEWSGATYLKVASNATGSWDIQNVAEVSEEFTPYYSIDVDAQGNTYLAYFETSDIFFASDKDGPFAPVNITNDGPVQTSPHVRVDREGIPHLLYTEYISEEEAHLFHGWVDVEGLHSERVTEDLCPGDFLGYDLVFDPMNEPHTFYIGDDECLWHAISGEPAWITERLNELSSEWPSAVADPLGSYHLAYDVGHISIHYITNMTGTWQDELVSKGGDPEGGNWRPCLDLEKVYGQYLGIGNPHVVWIRYDDMYWADLWYASKPEGVWTEEAITSVPDADEWPGANRYFAIDYQGYGHLVYDHPDDSETWQIFYAKSKEPLVGGIAETPVQSTPLSLKVRGAAVCFSLPQTSLIRLELYDATGRHVEHMASGTYEAGEHSIPINSTGLSAGVYFVYLDASGTQASTKLVLTR